ncbi:HPF/RaiA family ribosome-associated protein [Flavobacterium sp. RHBU_24]|uniref:HPF/RaiA family ribosome-associated protein n=1 Tax=Flavobacterium sp. RHBU_24 TaxID=3391185 RepID=UPI0039853B6B
MQIRVNTDNHIEGSNRMENYFDNVIQEKLKRFEERITNLEVYLADENSSDKKGTDDKRCTIEAHITGIKPLAVTNHADTVEKSVLGAVTKMKALLEHTFDKIKTH